MVLGASTASYRYSNMAALRLLAHGHDVVLLGKYPGQISDKQIDTVWPNSTKGIHTLTMYLAPENQLSYYDKILSSGIKRLIFNPGSENSELATLARQAGIEVDFACTLVLLASNQY